jgi:hypothetical protein
VVSNVELKITTSPHYITMEVGIEKLLLHGRRKYARSSSFNKVTHVTCYFAPSYR